MNRIFFFILEMFFFMNYVETYDWIESSLNSFCFKLTLRSATHRNMPVLPSVSRIVMRSYLPLFAALRMNNALRARTHRDANRSTLNPVSRNLPLSTRPLCRCRYVDRGYRYTIPSTFSRKHISFTWLDSPSFTLPRGVCHPWISSAVFDAKIIWPFFILKNWNNKIFHFY